MIWAKLKRVCIGSNWRFTLVRGLILGVVVYLLCSFVFLPFRVQGDSMLPRYGTGDFGFINAVAYRWSEPQRFHVVAIRMAGRNVMFLKRIIGLPGEKLEIRNGVVYIDAERLDEPYVQFNAGWDLKEQSLSSDEYLVIGDNRGMPMKQHKFGKVERDRIAGRM